jgi:glycosyltransferase involved in cell wall biosynthesis
VRLICVCSNSRVFGAETITLKLLSALKQRGHQIIAVTSPHSDGEFSRRLDRIGISEEIMPFGAIVRSFAPVYIKWTVYTLSHLPTLWRKWRKLEQGFQPDIVLWTSSRQALLVLPSLGDTPSFVVEHTNVTATRSNRWIYGRLIRKLSGFVAISDFMRGQLRSVGVPPEMIVLIKNGVFSKEELDEILQSSKRRLSHDPAASRIGIAGQIAPNKGYDSLIEAVWILKERNCHLTVEAFGDGAADYMSVLKQKIETLELAKIWHWNGYERDKTAIFGNMDICVVPSRFGDPFPTVAIEAGAYGLPVVASCVGGLPEIINDGITGWLVDPKVPEELADRIQSLVENPQQATQMGSAGRLRILQNFTVERMVSEFEELFSRLSK